MKLPRAEELQTILDRGQLDRATGILRQLDPAVAADAFMGMPWEQQQVLFRHLPIEFAAKLAPIFPYYHTFVLLHGLPGDRIQVREGQLYINGQLCPRQPEGDYVADDNGIHMVMRLYQETLPDGVKHDILKATDEGEMTNTPEYLWYACMELRRRRVPAKSLHFHFRIRNTNHIKRIRLAAAARRCRCPSLNHHRRMPLNPIPDSRAGRKPDMQMAG